MVDGQKKIDGWSDRQKKYMKKIDGWMDKKYMKKWVVGWKKKQMDGWMERKKRWMVGWIKKITEKNGWLEG